MVMVCVGVTNGPLKFLTARKILPLLDLLAKFKRVLACSCSPNFALLASSQSKFFISARARKKIAVLGILANARKDHSSPLCVCVGGGSGGWGLEVGRGGATCRGLS